MTIYDPSGVVVYEAPITKSATIKRVLMGDYYIELVFDAVDRIDVGRGCYILYNNHRFEIMSNVIPDDTNQGGLRYTLRFEAQQSQMKRCNVFWREGDNLEVSFALTSDISTFGQLIIDNVNAFLGGSYFSLGSVPSNAEMKAISFAGDSCWNAVVTIAETFGVEWWTEEDGENVRLCFGKLEIGDGVEFRKGDIVSSIPSKKGDDANYGTRFYVFGSTKNLPSDYGSTTEGGVTNNVVEKRLHLPNGQQYIDAWPNLSQEDIVEKTVFFDDVMPTNVETITDIHESVEEVIPGSSNRVYYAICADSPFGYENIIESEQMQANFTSGDLIGQTFDLEIDTTPETFNKMFRIVPKVMDESTLDVIPNANMRPRVGDSFILVGVELPQARVTQAEYELLAVGTEYAQKNSNDTEIYDCPTNAVYCHRNDCNYALGQRVTLVDDKFGDNGRQSRIQGYEKKLYDEYQAIYTVGDNSPYSRLASLEKAIQRASYGDRVGLEVNIIRSKADSTIPSDYNVYSALASEEIFLSKRRGGKVKGHTDFEKGLSMYGIPWEYDVERDAWTIKGNVIITKGLATYSTLNEDDVLSVFDGLPIDGRAIIWDNGVLTVNPEMVGGLNEDALKDYLDTNKYATQTWINEQKYTTEKWIEDKKFVSEDDLAEKYVTIETEQVITGLKDFTGGFKINSVPISYDAEKNALVLPSNVIIEGGLATYTKLEGFEDFGIMAAIETDEKTISKVGGVLHFIGEAGGLDESQLEDYLTTNGYATQDWVTKRGYLTSVTSTQVTAALGYTPFDADDFTYTNIKSELGISNWALASTKPSYTFSEITNTPTTLSGYGITNAYTKTEVQNNFLAIDGIADRAKILASSLTATSYLLFNSNELNHCNNGNTDRFWFGYRTPDGSSRSTNKWLFGSSAKTALADGEIWAGKVYIGDDKGDFLDTDFKAPLHVNGNAYVGGTFYLNGAPMTYNSSKKAWQIEGNLIVTGGLATYTKLSGYTNLDVMGGVVVDGVTIGIVNGALKYIGSTSGGGGITLNDVADYLEDNDYITSSGNAASATKATNIVLGTVSPSSTTSYYPAMVTGATNGSSYGIKAFGNPVRYALKVGTTSATGIAELILGNSTNSGYAGNSEGALCLYPASGAYATLKAPSVTSSYTNYLPKSSGTLLNENSLKTINGYSLVGSGNITISGGTSGVDLLNTENIEPASNMTYNVGSASYVYNTGYFQSIQPFRAYALRVYTAASSSSSFVERLRVGASGKITVALTSDSQAKEIFNVVGNIYTTGTVTESSARKMKDIDYEGEGIGLDVLKKVKVAKWHWKDKRDKRMHIGAIAEDLAEIIPEAVFDTEADDGTTTSSIAYGKAGFSIAASLIAPVVRHEDRIKELEKNIEKMQKELKQLRSA